ncbi:MAG: Slp family lipoprotein [Pseudomonadota bacterium]
MDIIGHRRSLKWFPLLTVLWLLACAPAIPPETLKNVDQSIPFESLLKDPEAFQGKSVLFGGDIIETENLPEKTLIIILQHSLNSKRRPIGGDASKGRFIVSAPEFLDPAIYRPGRQITVVGTVAGKEVRTLNEIEYAYPIIDRQHLHLWPVEKYVDTEPKVYFGIGIGVYR